jgi:hypothetical protein
MKSLSIIFSMLLIISSTLVSGQDLQNAHKSTAEQLIARIIKNTGSSAIPNTVDVIKEGDPQTPVTGIITCMFATGAPGSTRHISLLEDKNVDVVIGGEAQQWETYE